MPQNPLLLPQFIIMRTQAVEYETADLIARSLDAVIGAVKVLHDHPVPDTFLGRQPSGNERWLRQGAE